MRRCEDAFAEVGRMLDVLSDRLVERARDASRWAKERWEDLERWWAGTSAQARTSTIGLVLFVGMAAFGGAAWCAASFFANHEPEVTPEDLAVLQGLEARMAEIGASVSQPTGVRQRSPITPH